MPAGLESTDVLWIAATLFVLALFAIWRYRANRTLSARLDALEDLIERQTDSLIDIASDGLVLIKQLEEKLEHTVVTLAHERSGLPSTEGGNLETDQPAEISAENDEGLTATTDAPGPVPVLDAERAGALFADLMRGPPVDTAGITRLRLNWAGPAQGKSPNKPLHRFKIVSQVGDFVAFSSDSKKAFLFPNPEAGEAAVNHQFVFPRMTQGNFAEASEDLMPLRVEVHDDGSWGSVE